MTPRPASPGQPVTASLTRRIIISRALELMDRDGYAAFSMPRLGELLGVRTPSLYHHFKDRDDLMSEIAKQVVRQTDMPGVDESDHWSEHYVALSVNFRRAVLEHRNTAPVLLQFLPRDTMTRLYEITAERLTHVPSIPLRYHVLVLDGLEKLSLGTALIEAMSSRATAEAPFPHLNPETQPHLVEAVAQSAFQGEELFVETVRAFLRGVEAQARAEAEAVAGRRPKRPRLRSAT